MYNKAFDDFYECGECEKELSISDIDTSDWTCKECKEKVVIYSTETKRPLIRLFSTEVNKSDFIFNYHQGEFVEIRGITELTNKKQRMFGLANYGGQEVGLKDFVDCLWR